MIGTDDKRNRSVEVAYPNLGGACIEIERAFFVDLGRGIRRRENLDANVRGALENGELVDVLGSLGGDPSDIDGFDAACGRKRALGHDLTVRQELMQQEADIHLAPAVERSGWRTHKDVAMLIGLDTVGEFGKKGVDQNLGPARHVEPCLRNQIWQCNCDRHEAKESTRMASKQRVKRLRPTDRLPLRAFVVSGGVSDRTRDRRRCFQLPGDKSGTGVSPVIVATEKTGETPVPQLTRPKKIR